MIRALPWVLLLTVACDDEVLRYRRPKEDPPAAPAAAPPPAPVANTCDKAAPAAAEAPTGSTQCLLPKEAERPDPWNIVIEWQWKDDQVIVAPMVAHLTDTTGDGKIDDKDTPNIVFTGYLGMVYVLDGKTGKLVWSKMGFNSWGGVAIADLDGGGAPEVIAFDSAGHVATLHADGTPFWTSKDTVSVTGPQPTAADIDGDGLPEVIGDTLILNGQTGATLATIPLTYGIPYRMPAVADLDQDGEQDVIVGDTCYSLKKNVKWMSTIHGGYGHWSAIVQYDKDPEGEVAMVGSGRYAVYDSDGKELLNIEAGSNQPGPPCVADFDGDGTANIAWASSSNFTMRTLDGKEVWTKPVQDFSGLAACSGYDFNGDGIYELLFADETSLQIFDGKTGEVRHKTVGHASGTLWEYPVVADVDQDGSAELVMASNSYGTGTWTGITVLGQAKNQWLKSGDVWPVHDFAMTNSVGNASVPKKPQPSWLGYGVYRARPAADTIGADLAASIADACWTACDGTTRVIAVIANSGAVSSAPGVRWALYAIDAQNSAEMLKEGTIADAIPAGKTAPGIVIELDAAKVSGRTLRLVADAYAEQAECDEKNNVAEYKQNPCAQE